MLLPVAGSQLHWAFAMFQCGSEVMPMLNDEVFFGDERKQAASAVRSSFGVARGVPLRGAAAPLELSHSSCLVASVSRRRSNTLGGRSTRRDQDACR
jgi:hypothetical protein